jgi:tight adherence protein C
MTLPDWLSPPVIGAILFATAMLVAAPGLIGVLRATGLSERIAERLQTRGRDDLAIRRNRPRKETPLVDKVAEAASRVVPTNEEQLSVVKHRLMRAGYTHPKALEIFFAARLAAVVLPQLVLFFALPWIEGQSLPDWFPLAASILLAVAGFQLPSTLVNRRIEARERECSNGFPDMMDLLVACVEAGLSLDAAVIRVSEELAIRHRELSLQLKTLGLEMRAGRSRKAAWRSFADRIGLEEASSLATMLRQAEEMGTSLGETLRIFSSDMRQRRILMAEEKAMALPAKMTVPLIVFVFPVLLGVLVLPAVIRFQYIGY